MLLHQIGRDELVRNGGHYLEIGVAGRFHNVLIDYLLDLAEMKTTALVDRMIQLFDLTSENRERINSIRRALQDRLTLEEIREYVTYYMADIHPVIQLTSAKISQENGRPAYKGVKIDYIGYSSEDPSRELGPHLRKMRLIHTTNTLDVLLGDRVARLNGEYYVYEIKPFLSGRAITRISGEYHLREFDFRREMERFQTEGDLNPQWLIERYETILANRNQALLLWLSIWKNLTAQGRWVKIKSLGEVFRIHSAPEAPMVLEEELQKYPGNIETFVSWQAIDFILKVLAAVNPRRRELSKGKFKNVWIELTDIFVNDFKEN